MGANNVKNGFDLHKVKINLINVSFNIRKWQTNSESLCSLICNCEKSFDSENFHTAELYYYIYDFNDPVENFHLHGFLDLSLIAYGTCVYLKTATKSGNIDVSLLASKSRIVPAKKKFTIPTLELLGNFILSNLINVVYNTVSGEVVVANYFCWSDSSIALAWIKNVNKEYKIFIQSWVISICKNVDPSLWNYISNVKIQLILSLD